MLEYPFLHLWQGDILLLLQMGGGGVFLRAVELRAILMRISVTGDWVKCTELNFPAEAIKNFFFKIFFLSFRDFAFVYHKFGNHLFQPGANLGLWKSGFAYWIFHFKSFEQ